MLSGARGSIRTRMCLSIQFCNPLSQDVLLRFGQGPNVNLAEKARVKDLLHDPGFFETVARARTAFRCTNQGTQTCLVRHPPLPLTGFDSTRVPWRGNGRNCVKPIGFFLLSVRGVGGRGHRGLLSLPFSLVATLPTLVPFSARTSAAALGSWRS